METSVRMDGKEEKHLKFHNNRDGIIKNFPQNVFQFEWELLRGNCGVGERK